MRRRDREAALAELTAWPPRDVVMLLHQLPLNRARRLFWCLPIARGIGGWTSWTLRLARFRRRRVAGPPGCHPAPGQRRRCSRRGATPARRDGRTPSRATAPGLTVGHPACIRSRYRQRDRDPSLRNRRHGAGRADPRRVPGHAWRDSAPGTAPARRRPRRVDRRVIAAANDILGLSVFCPVATRLYL